VHTHFQNLHGVGLGRREATRMRMDHPIISAVSKPSTHRHTDIHEHEGNVRF
jgi:hypothetical protein